MSGVLHPVGPEPARTYWIRRGILFAVVLLLALGVVLSVANLTKAAVATAPPPVIAAAPGDTSASPKPSGLPTPTAVTSAPTPASPGVPSPGASSPGGVLASSSPQASGASPAVSGPGPSTSGPPSSAPSSGAPSNGASSPARANARPSPTVVGTPDCRPSDLRVTLTGDRTLSPGQKNRFTVSLINGGTQTCLVSVTDKNFELKVYSGKDRIWSSRDCSSVLTDFDKKLGSQSGVRWAMAWNGKRSVAGKSCQVGVEKPRAGTYWATAQLTGADPVQLRLIVS